MDECWKNLAGKIQGEVVGKRNVEDSEREAFKGRGAPLEWRRVRRSKKHRIKNGEKIAGQESSPCSESTTCRICKASRRS